jgi:hypothetical protein
MPSSDAKSWQNGTYDRISSETESCAPSYQQAVQEDFWMTAGPKKERFWYLHVDLICCVSANHVVYHQMSTWMLVDPAIELQRFPFMNDDQLAVCD